MLKLRKRLYRKTRDSLYSARMYLGGLIEKVKEERDLSAEDKIFVKKGIEGVGGFMKICFSLIKMKKRSKVFKIRGLGVRY
jgi:hypothetical protein